MSLKDTVNTLIRDANGNRAGGRDGFHRAKTPFLSEELATELRRQWKGAGRETARVWLKCTETDGSNPHYVTAWDGQSMFVCLTEQGLCYVKHSRLAGLKRDESWNDKTLLAHVRLPLAQEQLEKSDVDALLARCRQTAAKTGKARRESRFKSSSRFFESEGKVDAHGPPSETEMVPAPKHPTGAPEEPPGRDESVSWNPVDEATGKVKQRGLSHPRMKQDTQLKSREQVDVRDESWVNLCAKCGFPRKSVAEAESSGCSECGARETVTVRKENGSNKGVSASDGKAPAEMDKREKVDVRQEAEGKKCSGKSCDYSGPDLTYWGDKVYCAECAARAKVDVRHEAKDSPFGKAAEKFGDKKYPLGAKKPLVLFMLMKKGKQVSEAAKLKPFRRPDEETERQEVDSRENIGESTGRRFKSLQTLGENDDWHKAHAHKFYSNMMKFKSRKGSKINKFRMAPPKKAAAPVNKFSFSAPNQLGQDQTQLKRGA